MASTPPDRDADGNLSCPDCYGPIWDNRKKKADGTFNRKSPDFACKDKDDCDWAYWLEKPSGDGGGGGGGKRRKKKKPPRRSGGGGGGGKSGGSEAPLAVALYNAFQTAKQVVGKLKEDDFEIMSDELMIPDLAKELFRAHVESGAPFMSKAKKKKKPKPPPPPPPEEEEDEDEDEDDGGYEYVSDDDLPF